jgi:diguanylate cyclase (GGDEF)-like protein
LRNASRAADAYFRFGGDEFVAILHAGSDGSVAARRIIAAVAEPFAFGSQMLVVGVSIGVATYPYDGEDAQELIRAADTAMYKAKRAELGWAAASDVAPHE